MQVVSESLELSIDEKSRVLTVRNRFNGQRLLVCDTPLLMQPVFASEETAARLERVERVGEGLRLVYASDALDDFAATVQPGGGPAVSMSPARSRPGATCRSTGSTCSPSIRFSTWFASSN
jgi:hypothetical protein